MNKRARGFTVIELMVSIGILAILFTLTTINLSGLPATSSQGATIDVLIGDIKSQQTLAMSGNTSQGVHFDSTSYTLIPSGFVVNLDPGFTFSDVTFPGGDMNFAAGSGETSPGSFTLVNGQVGQTKVFNINKYGATY